jgi:hypothetical protein
MYFHMRGLPSPIHSTAVASLRSRVASVFASRIHSEYSRFRLGLKAAKCFCAFGFLASAAVSAFGTGRGFFAFLSGPTFRPVSLSRAASFT